MHGDILVPLAGIALPVVLVPTIMALRQAGQKRQYEHLERMKALETGQPVPGQTNWAGALVCSAIGAGVPIVAFLFTFLAYMFRREATGELWVAPVVTTFFALYGAGTISSKVFGPPKARTEGPVGKPEYDPDAYETVGR